MLKKTITYEDFDGVTQKEDFYFHISKDEIIDLELSVEGGLSSALPEMIKKENPIEFMGIFRKLIRKAYGERSEDGKDFIKNDEISDKFMRSPAFDALLGELLASKKVTETFFIGMFPKDLQKLVAASETAGPFPSPDQAKAVMNAGTLLITEPEAEELPWAHREPTSKELQSMTHDQLIAVYKRRTQS